MPKITTQEYVLYQGEKYQVEFYYSEKGSIPAKEYLESLKPKDESRKISVKLVALVKYIAEFGTIYDQTKYRIVDKKEKIYEFKPMGHRFFNFFYKEGKIILTNSYKKQSQKLEKEELKRAIRLKKDYISRVEGGTYYEKK